MTDDEIKLLEMQRLFFPTLPIWEYSVKNMEWFQVRIKKNLFDKRKNYRIQVDKPTVYPRSGRVMDGVKNE